MTIPPVGTSDYSKVFLIRLAKSSSKSILILWFDKNVGWIRTHFSGAQHKTARHHQQSDVLSRSFPVVPLPTDFRRVPLSSISATLLMSFNSLSIVSSRSISRVTCSHLNRTSCSWKYGISRSCIGRFRRNRTGFVEIGWSICWQHSSQQSEDFVLHSSCAT